ncbi:hypothetical protein D4R71_02405 [bacterium]|nr:MAG: hypothetical protein D4R71_02405 [bacterium]
MGQIRLSLSSRLNHQAGNSEINKKISRPKGLSDQGARWVELYKRIGIWEICKQIIKKYRVGAGGNFCYPIILNTVFN